MRLPSLVAAAAAAALTALSCSALAVPTYSVLLAFGDSLSDPGNGADLVDAGVTPFPSGARQRTPIERDGFVPVLPYETDRLSNGPVWVEQLAQSLGLRADRLSFGGTNFAVGGARLGGDGANTIPAQVDMFLNASPFVPPGALVTFWGGSNDARDAIKKVLDGEPDEAERLLMEYSQALFENVFDIADARAGDILLPNIPNLALTPEANDFPFAPPNAPMVSAAVTQRFNDAFDQQVLALEAAIAAADLAARLIVLDVFTLVNDIADDPGAFKLSNVTDACAAVIPVCSDPDRYLFWDGIHPTTATHGLIASAALRAVPAPTPALLLATGLLLLARRIRGR